jgi:hypothetical protein
MSPLNTEYRAAALWDGVDAALARATLSGILAHKLGPLAAYRLRRLGEPIPPVLQQEQRAASLAMIAGVRLIERIRAGLPGPFVLIKGPEVAHMYPGRARRFRDIDVLTTDARAAQRALLRSGFVEVTDDDLAVPDYHLPPLQWPALALEVEVHSSPKWPRSAGEPPLAQILEAAIPSATSVDGVLTPTPVHHTLILASHAWVHEPLRTLRDLTDIAALAVQADERELDRTARAWGIGRLWRTTSCAIDALFFGGRRTFPLRSWARHLESVRDRSRLESYLEWLSHSFWEVPPHEAPLQTLDAFRHLLKPDAGESWGLKLRRAPHAFRTLRSPVTREGDEVRPHAREDVQQS